MLTREEFIKKYANFVRSITKGTGIYPEVLFSQAIVESQGKAADGNYYVGQSKLAREYNNYFGIKAGKAWQGKSVDLKTGEYLQNGYEVITDAFRVYPSFEDSARDYIKFLKDNPRYTKAGVFSAPTPLDQFKALQKAGYSTSPTYASTLDKISTKAKEILNTVKENPAKTGIASLLFFLLIYGIVKSKKSKK